MATEVDIDLDTVTNPKQRAKLFKATVKEIRSKDVDIKLKVLTKFSDCRYLTDGDCMIPFIESVTIKKVFPFLFTFAIQQMRMTTFILSTENYGILKVSSGCHDFVF